MITAIFRDGAKSYRDLPRTLLPYSVEVPRRGPPRRRDARPRVPDEEPTASMWTGRVARLSYYTQLPPICAPSPVWA